MTTGWPGRCCRSRKAGTPPVELPTGSKSVILRADSLSTLFRESCYKPLIILMEATTRIELV
jgi:hypothetical protein